jgi:hypothetical protein
MYINFKAINVKTYEKYNKENEIKATTEGKTKKIEHQIASAVGCYIHSDHENKLPHNYFSCRDENVVELFCKWLIEYDKILQQIFDIAIPLDPGIRTPDEINCYYCDKPLEEDRVRDHDHLTGVFRGATHNKCNLAARKDKFVPVFFHNLSHYDAHLFINTLAKFLEGKSKLKLLAKNSEYYISFQFGCLRCLLIDSYRFLQASLDAATKSMLDEDFKITRKCYPNEEDFRLLRKKGSVPYSFYTSHESFKETSLTKEMFYDQLKDELLEENVYIQAREIWHHFKIQDHGAFIDLYLQSDVLLLADCFERFREVNMSHFKIDPCHCCSVPGLTWQAGLKFIDIELKLLPNIDNILFFEDCIRGGNSGIMGSRYSITDDNNELLYIDANNLYGWAMMEPQPYGGFR